MLNDMEDRTGFIYRATSPSGNSYIGQTCKTVEERWRQHVSEAKTYAHKGCIALNAAIIKYGADSFIVKTLWECTVDELDEYEIKFIQQYNTIAPNGYNLREGGNGRMSEVSRLRMIEGNINKTEYKTFRTVNEKLPKYVLYHREMNKNGTILEGYKVSDHPKGSNKSFLKRSWTIEERLQKAIQYKESLDTSDTYVDHSKKTPKHVSRYGVKGYQVNKPGSPRKFFNRGTRDENLTAACQHLKTISHA
jgi:hypothetical protein